MNFFSHAAVAGRFSESAAFAFGAMLPDFAGMLGRRWGGPLPPELERGISFHHLSDAAFHDQPRFRRLCLEGTTALRSRGLERGPARAAAHVTTEIFLDLFLARAKAARSAYLRALHAGTDPWLLATLGSSRADRDHLASLLETLIERGPVTDAPTEVVVERVARALARRPRLALADGDELRLFGWVETARNDVVAWAPELSAGLTLELERRLAA